jgi:hypothetical protein
MASINQTLIKHSKLGKKLSAEINYTLSATDFNSTNENVTFVFTIRSQKELIYAAGLLRVYKNVIKPFIDDFEYRKITGSGYDRFFYVGGKSSSFACGKTVHDTRTTFDLSIHYVENYLNRTVPNRPLIERDKSKYWLMINYVSFQHGHSSHFRKKYSHLSEHFKEVAIQELQLDLNYLDCFFKPVMEKLRRSSL